MASLNRAMLIGNLGKDPRVASTTGALNADVKDMPILLSRLNSVLQPGVHGPVKAVLSLAPEVFDDFRARALECEMTAWMFRRPRRKRPDMTRRWVMIGGIMICSEETYVHARGAPAACGTPSAFAPSAEVAGDDDIPF